MEENLHIGYQVKDSLLTAASALSRAEGKRRLRASRPRPSRLTRRVGRLRSPRTRAGSSPWRSGAGKILEGVFSTAFVGLERLHAGLIRDHYSQGQLKVGSLFTAAVAAERCRADASCGAA